MLGDPIPPGFDLKTFCARLTAASGVQCIPILDSYNGAQNYSDDEGAEDIAEALSDEVWGTVLEAYCTELEARA